MYQLQPRAAIFSLTNSIIEIYGINNFRSPSRTSTFFTDVVVGLSVVDVVGIVGID